MLANQGGAVPQAKQRIVLEFAREEEASLTESPYEKEKSKVRRLIIGSCKMMDNKLEKNGTFEFTPGVRLFIHFT